MERVLLRVEDRRDGIRMKVWGALDVDSAAELETILLLEASLQPPMAVLDLRGLELLHPCVRDRATRWVDAYRQVGSELAVLLPAR